MKENASACTEGFWTDRHASALAGPSFQLIYSEADNVLSTHMSLWKKMKLQYELSEDNNGILNEATGS